MAVELLDGLIEILLERLHFGVKRLDLVLTDQTDAGLGVRQRHRLPERDNAALDGGHGLELLMPGVEQLLARGQKGAFGPERVGSLGFLFGR